MRILFLAQIIPYPPDAGPKVKTWHVLRYLVSRGHQVTLVAFVRPEEVPYVSKLEDLCTAVYTVPMHRSRLGDVIYMLMSFIRRRPFLIERDDLQLMQETVTKLLKSESFDVIHADQLTMVQFSLNLKEKLAKVPKVIFDAHNAVWTIVDRMARNASWYLKPILKIEARRVKTYEANLLNQVDWVLAVTEEDKNALLDGFGKPDQTPRANISVVPIAVDTRNIQPVKRKPNSKKIFTLGTLHYPPNADGIRWFLNQVFPLIQQKIPDVSLTIVGKNPPQDFLEMAAKYPESIRVTGYVPELKPYLEVSAVVVVPVRAGGGMRVRILEAFAFGMPVITTTVGLEGIFAEPNKDVIVADSPSIFADRVIHILLDENAQENLAVHGRLLAEESYDWTIVLSQMDEIYDALAA